MEVCSERHDPAALPPEKRPGRPLDVVRSFALSFWPARQAKRTSERIFTYCAAAHLKCPAHNCTRLAKQKKFSPWLAALNVYHSHNAEKHFVKIAVM